MKSLKRLLSVFALVMLHACGGTGYKPGLGIERYLLDGKAGYEQVVEKEGKRYLRSATPVPVVMDKCIMCHENYKGKTIIGALGYTVPVE